MSIFPGYQWNFIAYYQFFVSQSEQIKTGVEPPSVLSIAKLVFGEFDTSEAQQWMEHHWTLCLYFIVAYCLFICYGPEYMRNRKPMNLKWTMTVWNFSLAIFSILACMTILPEFYSILSKPNGFHTSVCAPWYVSQINCKKMLKVTVLSWKHLVYN